MAILTNRTRDPTPYFRLVGKYVFILLMPILLCFITIVINNQLGYMTFILLLMCVYWMTEVLPLAVTALLPMGLYPLFGIQDAGTVVKSYFTNTSFVLFGGLVMASAIEHQNLHRRFALRVLLLIGTDPKRLMLGFMCATAFLSMWISNTATTAMMIPIARAVLDEIGQTNPLDDGEQSLFELRPAATNETREQETEDDASIVATNKTDDNNESLGLDARTGESTSCRTSSHSRFCKGILLCVPYAANVGGTGALTGTNPNIICATMVESLYGAEPGLNYGTWMLLGLPGMVVSVLLCWAWLQWFYLSGSCRCTNTTSTKDMKDSAGRVKTVIQRAYDELGPIRFAEWAVLGHFIVLVLLWVTQDPKIIPGWASLFTPGFVKGSTPAILVSVSLFMFPSEMPRKFWKKNVPQDNGDVEKVLDGKDMETIRRRRPKKVKSIPALLNWEVLEEKMPWGVLLIVGGGFALADGCKVSGLSSWMADHFTIFQGMSPPAIALIAAFMVSIVTEFISNVVTSAIFLPIFAEISVAMKMNPLYMMLSGALAASFAFMLPVATAPNAIAFANKEIKVMDMVKSGCVLNVVCLLILTLNINNLGRIIFKVHIFPDWAVVDQDIINATDVNHLLLVTNSTSSLFSPVV